MTLRRLLASSLTLVLAAMPLAMRGDAPEGAKTGEPTQRHELTDLTGQMRCLLDLPEPFTAVPLGSRHDVFFPEGELLARFVDPAGRSITISVDVHQPYRPAEQAAFRAAALDRVSGGSGRHAVWGEHPQEWILQAFVAPAEHIVSAQTFVEDFPVAVVFWLPRTEGDALEDPLIEAILTGLGCSFRADKPVSPPSHAP